MLWSRQTCSFLLTIALRPGFAVVFTDDEFNSNHHPSVKAEPIKKSVFTHDDLNPNHHPSVKAEPIKKSLFTHDEVIPNHHPRVQAEPIKKSVLKHDELNPNHHPRVKAERIKKSPQAIARNDAKAMCTGDKFLPWGQGICYAGLHAGESIIMRVNTFDSKTSAGSVSLLGSGLTPIHCERKFKKADKLIDISDVQECLSNNIQTTGVRYCPDQDYFVVDVNVNSLPHELVLEDSPCPSFFLEEASRNDIYSHSAWIWDSPTCTGNGDPQSEVPHCYTGSKMGEVVTIKINTFGDGKGTVLVTGSGLKALKCKRGFSKAQQLISVERLEECLPSSVKPEGIKYCSDQNQYLLDAHVGMLGVELALIPAPCPSFLLEGASAGESALEKTASAKGEWAWFSTLCTGSNDPPTHTPFCFTGSKMGETVTGMAKFDGKGIGTFSVAASGLKSLTCAKRFTKTLQMLEVKELDGCLPASVKAKGVKYCSDQNSIILDAVVGSFPVEMVLSAIPCPKSLLEASDQHMVGQISASGVVGRIMRTEQKVGSAKKKSD